jgi:hypothetical protein
VRGSATCDKLTKRRARFVSTRIYWLLQPWTLRLDSIPIRNFVFSTLDPKQTFTSIIHPSTTTSRTPITSNRPVGIKIELPTYWGAKFKRYWGLGHIFSKGSHYCLSPQYSVLANAISWNQDLSNEIDNALLQSIHSANTEEWVFVTHYTLPLVLKDTWKKLLCRDNDIWPEESPSYSKKSGRQRCFKATVWPRLLRVIERVASMEDGEEPAFDLY